MSLSRGEEGGIGANRRRGTQVQEAGAFPHRGFVSAVGWVIETFVVVEGAKQN